VITEKKQRIRSKKKGLNLTVDSNKLTLGDILQDNNKYEVLNKVTFDNGFYTEIYAYFRPSTIDSLLESFASFLTDYEKTLGKFNENKIVDYLNLHILIYFSTLVNELPYTIEEKVSVFKQILDSEYAEKIFESFNREEVRKVFDRMWKKLDAYKEALKANSEMREKLKQYVRESDLENKQIIESVMFNEDGEDVNVQ